MAEVTIVDVYGKNWEKTSARCRNIECRGWLRMETAPIECGKPGMPPHPYDEKRVIVRIVCEGCGVYYNKATV